MIHGLLQGAWNLGHRRRMRRLEDRVERLERWIQVHGPFVDPGAVYYPFGQVEGLEPARRRKG
jgi:hypothetical protein